MEAGLNGVKNHTPDEHFFPERCLGRSKGTKPTPGWKFDLLMFVAFCVTHAVTESKHSMCRIIDEQR